MATAKNVRFEYDDREISLIDRLPAIYHAISDYHAITNASATELFPLYNRLSKLLDDQFISTASEEVIARWEKYLKLTPKGTDTLEERRFRVQVAMNDMPPYTDDYLKNKLDSLCGKNLWRWHRDYDRAVLIIEVSFDSLANTESVINMVRSIIPANLELQVRGYRSRHSELNVYTHAKLGAFTHEEIKYATWKDVVTFEITGNPVECNPVDGTVLYVSAIYKPVQDTTIEPYGAGCGKNLMPPWEQGNVSGTTGADSSNSTIVRSGFAAVVPGTTYTVWRSVEGSSFAVRGYDADRNFIGTGSSAITLVSGSTADNPIDAGKQRAVIKPKDGVYFLRFIDYTNDLSVQYQLEEGNVTNVVYVPYCNICPIEKLSPVTITINDTTYSHVISEPFYGGTLNWNTGTLTVDRGYIELNGSESGWLISTNNAFIKVPDIIPEISELVSNQFVNVGTAVSVNQLAANQMRQGNEPCNVVFGNPNNLTEGEWRAKLETNPIQLVYRLANPYTIQFDPINLTAESGINVISTNGESVTVSGY